MTRTWIGLVVGIAVATAVYRALGWIRMEKTGAEITKEAFPKGSLTPRYRQTQPANKWKLRIPRRAERRKSA